MRMSLRYNILLSIFFILSSISFIQCTQKDNTQISEDEWASLPADGPYLLASEREINCSG